MICHMNDTSNNEVPVNSKLCYLSVVALFLAIITYIMPSLGIYRLTTELIAFAAGTISLIRICRSNGRLNGKRLAISAVAVSLLTLIYFLIFSLLLFSAC